MRIRNRKKSKRADMIQIYVMLYMLSFIINIYLLEILTSYFNLEIEKIKHYFNFINYFIFF